MASIVVQRRTGSSYLAVGSAAGGVKPYETIRLLAQGFVPLTDVEFRIPSIGFVQVARAVTGNAWVDTLAPGYEGTFEISAEGRTNPIPIIGMFTEETVRGLLLVTYDAPAPPEEPPGGADLLGGLSKTLTGVAIIAAVGVGAYVAYKILTRPQTTTRRGG